MEETVVLGLLTIGFLLLFGFFGVLGIWLIRFYAQKDPEKTRNILSILFTGLMGGLATAFLLEQKAAFSKNKLLSFEWLLVLFSSLGFLFLLFGLSVFICWIFFPSSNKSSKGARKFRSKT